jgi:hypothetical protein
MIRITSQLDLNEYLNNYSKKKFLIPIYNSIKKKKRKAGCQWLTLDTWEAEIRRIMVQGQPEQSVGEIPSPK